MDYMQDIMTRLQKGESVEDIAAQMTKDINAANAAFQEEKNKKAKLEPKIKAARAAMDALANFYELYAGSDDIVVAGLRELDAEDVVNDLEREWPVIELMMGLNSKPKAKDDGKSAADPIEEFLNKFVRTT